MSKYRLICFVDQLLLEDIRRYRFLSNGYMALPGVDDAQEFQNTIKSMEIMHFQPDEITGKSLELTLFVGLHLHLDIFSYFTRGQRCSSFWQYGICGRQEIGPSDFARRYR